MSEDAFLDLGVDFEAQIGVLVKEIKAIMEDLHGAEGRGDETQSLHKDLSIKMKDLRSILLSNGVSEADVQLEIRRMITPREDEQVDQLVVQIKKMMDQMELSATQGNARRAREMQDRIKTSMGVLEMIMMGSGTDQANVQQEIARRLRATEESAQTLEPEPAQTASAYQETPFVELERLNELPNREGHLDRILELKRAVLKDNKRNKPCPCGSIRKFSKCHFATISAIRTDRASSPFDDFLARTEPRLVELEQVKKREHIHKLVTELRAAFGGYIQDPDQRDNMINIIRDGQITFRDLLKKSCTVNGSEEIRRVFDETAETVLADYLSRNDFARAKGLVKMLYWDDDRKQIANERIDTSIRDAREPPVKGRKPDKKQQQTPMDIRRKTLQDKNLDQFSRSLSEFMKEFGLEKQDLPDSKSERIEFIIRMESEERQRVLEEANTQQGKREERLDRERSERTRQGTLQRGEEEELARRRAQIKRGMEARRLELKRESLIHYVDFLDEILGQDELSYEMLDSRADKAQILKKIRCKWYPNTEAGRQERLNDKNVSHSREIENARIHFYDKLSELTNPNDGDYGVLWPRILKGCMDEIQIRQLNAMTFIREYYRDDKPEQKRVFLEIRNNLFDGPGDDPATRFFVENMRMHDFESDDILKSYREYVTDAIHATYWGADNDSAVISHLYEL